MFLTNGGCGHLNGTELNWNQKNSDEIKTCISFRVPAFHVALR